MSTIVEAPPEVTPQVTPAVEPTTLLTPAKEVAPPPGWREALPEDLRAEKSLESFKDIASLAKSYIETKKLVGQRALKPLTKDSTPEEIAAYRQTFGIPETPADYFKQGVSRPEVAAGEGWDTAAEGEFLKAMHAVHAPPGVVQAALNFYGGLEAAKQNAAVGETHKAAAELRQEWGPTYEANLGRANRAIQEFGGAELIEFFERTGAGRNPIVVKAFSKIGNALVESGHLDASGIASGMTPDEARSKIAEKRAEMAKLPEGHPRTKELIDEVLALTRVAHR